MVGFLSTPSFKLASLFSPFLSVSTSRDCFSSEVWCESFVVLIGGNRGEKKIEEKRRRRRKMKEKSRRRFVWFQWCIHTILKRNNASVAIIKIKSNKKLCFLFCILISINCINLNKLYSKGIYLYCIYIIYINSMILKVEKRG